MTINPQFRIPYFIAALLCLLSTIAFAQDRPLAPEWHDALKPLDETPVQDFGFVRSVYTFGDNHLGAITDKSSFDGMDAMETVLFLMAVPEQAQKLPLLKVRPDLAKGFGKKRISLAEYRDPATMEKLRQLVAANEKLMDAVGDLDGRANHLEALEHDFAIFPRPGEWLAPTQQAPATPLPHDAEIAKAWDALKKAVRANDPKAGGQAAAALAAAVNASAAEQKIKLPNLKVDYFYHHHKPFMKSWLYYLLAAMAFGASLLVGRPGLGWAGYALMVLGFAEQLVGTAARWMLAGRAPLSNMYESFTFAIGGLVLVALIFELLWRNRLAGLGGATLGFVFMVLAHKMPIFDSQIRPLMPALQSSWLTYHVVVIMLSYSAFSLSFFLSLMYMGKDLLGGDASKSRLLRALPTLNALDVFNYKIIAVGFPLLTLGIIFGAVWAATAWGRPWGFDPKETWSAITWLIYAIYLHARYLAGWKGRRAAVLSILGYFGVLFTYLGVNYLLPGLHSYV